MIPKPTFIFHQGPNERWIPILTPILAEWSWCQDGRTTGFSTTEESVEGWLSSAPQLLLVSDRGDLERTSGWVSELKHEAVHLRAALVGSEEWPPGCQGGIPAPFDYYIDLLEEPGKAMSYGSGITFAEFIGEFFPGPHPGIRDGHLAFLRQQEALHKHPA